VRREGEWGWEKKESSPKGDAPLDTSQLEAMPRGLDHPVRDGKFDGRLNGKGKVSARNDPRRCLAGVPDETGAYTKTGFENC